MPRKGERVGDAYVEIHANGDDIDTDIRKGFRNADGTVNEAGRRHGRKYGDGFDEENTRTHRILNSLRRQFGLAEKDTQIQASSKRLGARVADWFGDEAKDTDWADNVTRRLNALRLTTERTGKSFDPLNIKVRGSAKGMDRLVDGTKRVSHNFADTERHVNDFRKRLDVLDDRIDHYANVSGRAFGRGARNNFINLFGAGVRGFVLLANIIPKTLKVIDNFKNIITDMRTAFNVAGGGAEGFIAALGTGGKAFSAGAAGALLLVAGLAALVVIIGPLVALLSGLAAAVTALAASLSFALIGAVGALVGAIAPLVAGLGVVGLAIYDLNKNSKKAISEALKPLSKEIKGLADIAGTAFRQTIPEAARGLAPVFKSLRPLVRQLSEAMADVTLGFVDGLRSPTFKAFLRDMTDFLPGAVRQLGSIFSHTFGIIGGLFRSLIPLTREFLGWLDRVTGQFSTWINSTVGQARMKLFWADTLTSIKSVGRFLGAAGGALAELFKQGRGAGDTIFDDMANALRRFTNYLRANPNAVHNWFAHGIKTARKVGHAIDAIAGAIKALDTPANRALGKALLGTFTIALNQMAASFHFVGELFAGLVNQIGDIAVTAGQFFSLLGKAPRFGWAKKLGADLQIAGFHMQNFGHGVSTLGDEADHSTSAFDKLDAAINGTKQAFRGSYNELLRFKLLQGGTAASARLLGITQRDLSGAAKGNEGAIARVNRVLSNFHGGTVAQQQAMRSLKGSLRDLGVTFDSTGKKILFASALTRGWNRSLAGIKDKKLRFAVQQTGFFPTLAAMKTLTKQFNLTPKQLKIIAKANGFELTNKQLKTLTGSAKEVDKQRPTPKVTVDPRPSLSSLDSIRRRAGEVSRIHATPQVTVRAGSSMGILQGIINTLGRIHDKVIDVTTRHHTVGTPSKFATARGGIFSGPQNRLIAEDGDEAVVPLDRPLSEVDPAVRWLSAIAQGLNPSAGGGNLAHASGRSVHIDKIDLISNAEDPVIAAREWTSGLVARTGGF